MDAARGYPPVWEEKRGGCQRPLFMLWFLLLQHACQTHNMLVLFRFIVFRRFNGQGTGNFCRIIFRPLLINWLILLFFMASTILYVHTTDVSHTLLSALITKYREYAVQLFSDLLKKYDPEKSIWTLKGQIYR